MMTETRVLCFDTSHHCLISQFTCIIQHAWWRFNWDVWCALIFIIHFLLCFVKNEKISIHQITVKIFQFSRVIFIHYSFQSFLYPLILNKWKTSTAEIQEHFFSYYLLFIQALEMKIMKSHKFFLKRVFFIFCDIISVKFPGQPFILLLQKKEKTRRWKITQSSWKFSSYSSSPIISKDSHEMFRVIEANHNEIFSTSFPCSHRFFGEIKKGRVDKKRKWNFLLFAIHKFSLFVVGCFVRIKITWKADRGKKIRGKSHSIQFVDLDPDLCYLRRFFLPIRVFIYWSEDEL
jgi:hypothetical protein